MQNRMRLAVVLAASGVLLTGCGVTPPDAPTSQSASFTGTGNPSDTPAGSSTPSSSPSATPTLPTPTAVSCSTLESELAYTNKLVTAAAADFGDDPHAAIERIRVPLKYIGELRDASDDVQLEGLLNDVAVEGNDFLDMLDRVMQDGTILTEFETISQRVDDMEASIDQLITYCRF